MTKASALLLPLAAALTLAACDRTGGGGGNSLASLDNQLVGNDVDPALTSALADQIAVDPALANQSNRNAVRTPETPTQAQYPAEATAAGKAGGAVAQAAASTSGTGCGLNGPFDRNAAWANRLPAAFSVFPGGRIVQAAGYDRAGCRMRVVTFTVAADWQRVLDWYNTQAIRAGYDSEHQIRGDDHVLAGTNPAGAAYYLIVTPKGGASEVALIANGGR